MGKLGSFRIFRPCGAEIGFVPYIWVLGLWDWVRFAYFGVRAFPPLPWGLNIGAARLRRAFYLGFVSRFLGRIQKSESRIQKRAGRPLRQAQGGETPRAFCLMRVGGSFLPLGCGFALSSTGDALYHNSARMQAISAEMRI